MESSSGEQVESRFDLLVLTIALVIVLLVLPFFEQMFVNRLILHVGLTVLILLGVMTNRRRRTGFWIMGVLALLAVPLAWLSYALEIDSLFVISCILEAAFFLFLAAFMMRIVLTRHIASFQSVFGAICAYLLIGLAWATLYWAMEAIDDTSLQIAHRSTVVYGSDNVEVTAFSQLVYYSFVTMSTLGYGDIIPTTPLAQQLAWIQSVAGQFYIAVLVARLVSAIPKESFIPKHKDKKQQEDDEAS